MKTIAVCGSMKVRERMLAIEQELVARGFAVLLPNMNETGDYVAMEEPEQYEFKNRMILDHLKKIQDADAVLVVNERLKDIDGYIGANSFLEMGFALANGKKIFLLNDIPEQANKVEIGGMKPVVLGGDVSKLSV